MVYTAPMEEIIHAFRKGLVGKSERKRQLTRLRRRWRSGNKMGLWKIERECVDSINLVQDRDQ
jgi:hypothetical protein